MTTSDKILVLVLVVVAFVSLWRVSKIGKQGRLVVIEQNGELVKELPLDSEATVNVRGPLGITVVKVENGKARIVSSPCPRKLCVRMGTISRAGETVVCVPNKVVVRIKGEERVDAVTR